MNDDALVEALPEGAWVLTKEAFLVPSAPYPGTDLHRQIHADVQQIVTLIYAMLDCGMDMYTLKMRLLGTDS